MTEKYFEDELRKLEQAGLRRSLVDGPSFPGLNLSSNDYLGLSRHPAVQKAALQAVQNFGTGGTSSRLLAGTNELHTELEKNLAHFLGFESALVFSSGYHVNMGVIPALAGAGDLILVDRLCHASILDGIRLSDARFATFEHNDIEDLKKLLETKRSKYRRVLVITEGIFSMDGDHSLIKEIVQVAHQFEAMVYLDEAHSFGVLGPEGGGLAAQSGVLDQIDIFVGTLSKSIGSQGGFVAGSISMIELLISRCRSFIYTTSLAPPATAAALAALKLFPQLEERRNHIQIVSDKIRSRLKEMNFDTGGSETQIIPVFTGDIETTRKLSNHLLNQGFFVPSIRPPTVPLGEGRVRLSITYAMIEGWDALMKAFSSYPERPQRKNKKIVQTT